jgi:predicted alpha/beta-fold hydrolase
LRDFVPFFKNPHLLTIAGNYWRRPTGGEYFPTEGRLYETEPDVRVLVHSQRPAAPPVAEVIVVHGLEGSSQSGYAQSLAYELLQAGWAAHRFNMRSCGGTEHLSGPGLYHSGQTSDLLAVVRQIKTTAPIFLAGFSLGGNVALKLAGELGERASELIAGVVAVSTPIDLAACARRLQRPSNFLYGRRFLGRLKRRILVKAQSAPGLFALEDLDAVKSVYDFDDKFTAPLFGFGTADNYYATQSSNQFLERIQVPALLIHAKDDPLVPFEMYDHPAFKRNPHLTLLAVEHGGHVGFISKTPPRFWLDHVLLEWMNEVRNKTAADCVP